MNPNARKNIVYSLILFAVVLLVYAWRTREERSANRNLEPHQPGKVAFFGNALDAEYRVTYLDEDNRVFKPSIDSMINAFSLIISISEPTSEINRLNFRDTLLSPSSVLLDVFGEANRVFDLYGGAIDPTMKPIEDVWTFSRAGARLQDSLDIRLVLPLVGLKKIAVTDTLVRKSFSGIFLDFSKSAKGYLMDMMAEFLEERGIENYLIQIGGENLAKGKNERDELWKIGVYYLADSLGARADGIVALQNKAISTAGDFQQTYTEDSVRLSYTLDPRTGLPVRHGLLGVTVVGPDAKTADALSDALMVLGWREAMKLDSSRSDLAMLFIYNERSGKLKQYVSPELTDFLSFPVK
ncbi:FAD:protein FMN transferase [Algoriphagus aestuariicola]|uniref:FAD:protein FMN transferase n=1 Tax=Algoriphagus aestuariicola TaxID=1852016 RepID=A0ABS3BSK9_9BACT|nr:FAD:protein FMN transferase [Algoriphagus aestuariicola]MBN7802057.1 FAD:protein FMN transferase [Algoriphagus aestuariicola]